MKAVRLPEEVYKKLQRAGTLPSTPGAVVSGAPRRRPANYLSEEDIQRQCISWADLNESRLPALRWMTHIPNGGKRPRGEAGKLKALGTKPGVLDLKMFWPAGGYVGLAIEMKSTDGRLRPEQREWRDHLLTTGWCVEVCRSLDEFVAVVSGYLGDPRRSR